MKVRPASSSPRAIAARRLSSDVASAAMLNPGIEGDTGGSCREIDNGFGNVRFGERGPRVHDPPPPHSRVTAPSAVSSLVVAFAPGLADAPALSVNSSRAALNRTSGRSDRPLPAFGRLLPT